MRREHVANTSRLYLVESQKEHSKREVVHGVHALQIRHDKEYGSSSGCKWPIHLTLL